MRSEAALRSEAVRLRRPPPAFGAAPGAAAGAADVLAAAFAGRPRRTAGPCRASIARFRRSRSAINSETICSVAIVRMLPRNLLTCKTLPRRRPGIEQLGPFHEGAHLLADELASLVVFQGSF